MSKIYKMRIRYIRDFFLSGKETGAALRDIVINSGLVYAKAENAGGLTPRITFSPPLAQGYGSECEFADIYLEEFSGEGAALTVLSKLKKEGIIITEAKNIPYKFPSVASLAEAAEYAVSGFEKFNPPPPAEFLKKDFFASVAHENGVREEIKVNPHVVSAAAEDGILKIILRSVNGRGLKVELFLAGWLNIPDFGRDGDFSKTGIKIIKKNLYYKNSPGDYIVI